MVRKKYYCLHPRRRHTAGGHNRCARANGRPDNDDGGFTAPNPNNFLGSGVWQYGAGTGWSVNGRNRASAQLISQQYVGTGGTASFSFSHSFSFERNLFGVCFDGGLLLASINGAGFAPVTPLVSASTLGYRGPISSNGGSTRAGENAFCGFPNDQALSVVNSSFSQHSLPAARFSLPSKACGTTPRSTLARTGELRV